jgi:anti-anti-sigma factor
MPLTTARASDTLTYLIKGRFDFSLHKEFRAAHEAAPGVKHYILDLTEAVYMDSSALGMILLLREWAQEKGADVRIKTRAPIVRKILAMAHFEKLFPID